MGGPVQAKGTPFARKVESFHLHGTTVCRCLDGGADSKATLYATWALGNLLVDSPAAQVSYLTCLCQRSQKSPLAT